VRSSALDAQHKAFLMPKLIPGASFLLDLHSRSLVRPRDGISSPFEAINKCARHAYRTTSKALSTRSPRIPLLRESFHFMPMPLFPESCACTRSSRFETYLHDGVFSPGAFFLHFPTQAFKSRWVQQNLPRTAPKRASSRSRRSILSGYAALFWEPPRESS